MGLSAWTGGLEDILESITHLDTHSDVGRIDSGNPDKMIGLDMRFVNQAPTSTSEILKLFGIMDYLIGYILLLAISCKLWGKNRQGKRLIA